MKHYSRAIVITGGAGFIGSHVVRLFVNKYPDYHIINIDKLTYAGNLANLDDIKNRPNYTFLKADICDFETILQTLRRYDVDGIIHLAAESHVDRSIKDPFTFAQTNVMGTLSMLQAAKIFWESQKEPWKMSHVNADGDEVCTDCRFYHISTDEVYGALELTDPQGIETPFSTKASSAHHHAYGQEFFTEETKYQPHSPYSASKASSDHFVRAFHDTYGMPTIVTNCSNNYGPYQFPEKLIPLFINNIRHRKPLPVYGTGENVRDWLYVEDHAKGIDMVQEQGRLFETYNIGGHNEKQNIEIIHIILDTLNEMLPDEDPRKAHINEELITYVEDRKGHDRRYAIAPDKIKAEIGWYPETMFAEGIKKTIKWYFEHEDWMANVTSGDYQKYYEEMYRK